MDYLEFKITCREEFREILIAELSAIGFDSFLETEKGIEAYAESTGFDRESYEDLIKKYKVPAQISIDESILAKINWNEEWEKNYDPISVDDLVYVRASFHPKAEGFKHEIIINPKMSFGTGHHATTFLMLRHLGGIDLKNKRVIDVGSGTGILAIMAHLLGADEVEAFDIDDWCMENGNENFALNGMQVKMGLGTIKEVKPKGKFEVILANINKNILLDELPIYTSLMNPSSLLLLSGFYTEDVDDLVEAAKKVDLRFIKAQSKDGWASIILEKI